MSGRGDDSDHDEDSKDEGQSENEFDDEVVSCISAEAYYLMWPMVFVAGQDILNKY